MRISITYEKVERVCEEFDAEPWELEILRNGDVPERMMTQIAEDLDGLSCDVSYDYCVTNATGITIVDWGN